MSNREKTMLAIFKSKMKPNPILIRFKDGWRKGGKPITDQEASASIGTKIIFTKPNHDDK